VFLCRNLQNTGVSFGGESIFGTFRETSTFEHFTVEPELIQSTWNFVNDLLVCICSQGNLFEEKRWRFGEAIKYTKVYQMGVVYHSGVDDCIYIASILGNQKYLGTTRVVFDQALCLRKFDALAWRIRVYQQWHTTHSGTWRCVADVGYFWHSDVSAE